MDKLGVLKYKKVLYVEDDSIVAESTLSVLEHFFEDITFAKDGLEALHVIKEKNFDIAILDLKIPHHNGLEIASALRKKSQEVLIMMVSSYQEIEDMRKAMKLGMIDYIPKPLSFEELQRTLLECAKKFHQRQEYINEKIFYDFHKKQLYKEERLVPLTKNEVMFIELVQKHKSQLITYELIAQELYNSSHTDMNISSIKNLVFRLRKKLEMELVENVFGVGYRVL